MSWCKDFKLYVNGKLTHYHYLSYASATFGFCSTSQLFYHYFQQHRFPTEEILDRVFSRPFCHATDDSEQRRACDVTNCSSKIINSLPKILKHMFIFSTHQHIQCKLTFTVTWNKQENTPVHLYLLPLDTVSMQQRYNQPQYRVCNWLLPIVHSYVDITAQLFLWWPIYKSICVSWHAWLQNGG